MGLYARIAIGLVVAAMIAWVVRINHLNNEKDEILGNVVISLRETDASGRLKVERVGKNGIIYHIQRIAQERDTARKERDAALQVVDLQTASIDRLEQETAEAARRSAESLKLVQAAIRERDAWIKRAKTAGTRTERLSAEAEVGECERVMIELFEGGF